MTTEVAILNKQAVAIASDSASTGYDEFGRPIYSTANKIFSLSTKEPVAVMIYGSASYMGIPWETVIKVFRDKLADTRYNSLQDYGNRFIQFLQEEKEFYPESVQDNYVEGHIYDYLGILRGAILDNIEYHFENKDELGTQEMQALIEDIVDHQIKVWKEGKTHMSDPEVYAKRFTAKYSQLINDLIAETFEDLPLSDQSKMRMQRLAALIFIYYPKSSDYLTNTGVVITGFGHLDIFPSLVSYKVQGVAMNTLKYKEESHRQIDHQNTAMIIPFAQDEVIRTFIDGISPLMDTIYYNFIEDVFGYYPQFIVDALAEEGGLNDEQRLDLEDRIRQIGIDNFREGYHQINQIKSDINIRPILTVASILPKNELAEMADSLVNLTCLRKRFSTDEETVGGPVDVAVISKGDGLIWIRRKNYFDPNDNYRFLNNLK